MIVPFVIFAVLILLLLLVTLYFVYPASGKVSTVPGLDPSSEREGNIGDIKKAGSLTQFLLDLHERHGDIVSFWIGPKFTVSIASADLLKEARHLSDRTTLVFSALAPLIGSSSVKLTNGDEGLRRRRLMDKALTATAVAERLVMFEGVCGEISTKWSTMLDEQHVPLSLHMQAAVLKIMCRFLFGDRYADDKILLELRKKYDMCYELLEAAIVEDAMPSGLGKFKTLTQARDELKANIERTLPSRKEDGKLLIDIVKKEYEEKDLMLNDCLTYLLESVPTTSNLLIWCLYFLATNKKIQEKLYKEISANYVEGEPLTVATLSEFEYMTCVLKETLRSASITPVTVRFSQSESCIGAHNLPKRTPIITCLAALMNDEEIFPNPTKFDPERFSEGSNELPELSFCPFGYAGNRKCPAEPLALTVSQVMLATLLSKYKVSLIPGLIISKKYGLVTSPSDEVWITIEPR